MAEATESIQSILEKIREHDIQLVRFEMSDYYAISHNKGIPARHFKSKVESGVPFIMCHLSFDPQAALVQGTGYAEEVNYGDCVYFPDLNTFQILPWQDRTARVLLRAHQGQNLLDGYPRNIAERQLSVLKNLGYSLFSAHEHEFFVVDGKTKEPVTDGVQIRSTLRMGENQKFIDQIRDQLPQVGVDLESIETEYAPGQFEISYKPAFGIRAADNAFTYKTSIKEIARQHGLLASFMGKPFKDQSGSGAHFNHSLWDVNGTKSVMYDAKSSTGLSEVAEQWIAGILYHAPAITGLVSPTLNCMNRYRDFSFAPTRVTWGIDNRTCALRVKVNEEGTYVENRMCSAAGCPYIGLAAVVAAGIDGIRNKLKLPPACDKIAHIEENLPPKTARLPSAMEAALECLLNDNVIRNAMGEEFIQCFVALKTHEQKVFNEAISSGKEEFEWARDYYFYYI